MDELYKIYFQKYSSLDFDSHFSIHLNTDEDIISI